ncbi:MAG TPA: hypothetical protein VNI34_10180 [Candidatus Nitrosotalea sp.]|nr:hypothetical protein [Candidatus Nitrosotalea sp.]
MAEAHRDQLAELKIPAQSEFISVAKRVATSLAVQMGFTLEEIDELGIAVSQACDSTIDAAEECWGGVATLKLGYSRTARGIAVEVEALAPQSAEALARVEVTPAPPVRQPSAQSRAQQALTQEMIRLFVDDFLPQIDAPRGRIRFRMVKYLVS